MGELADDGFGDVDPPHTDDELAEMRAKCVAAEAEFGHEITAFTCDSCGYRYKCPLVFDGYNTDDDCLMDK